MKNLLNPLIAVIKVATAVLAQPAFGQGAFQNLDFESASPPFVVLDPNLNIVVASNAIPGWIASFILGLPRAPASVC